MNPTATVELDTGIGELSTAGNPRTRAQSVEGRADKAWRNRTVACLSRVSTAILETWPDLAHNFSEAALLCGNALSTNLDDLAK